MQIKSQFVQMPNILSVDELVIKKLQKLGDKFDWIIGADVFFREEPDTAGKGRICEIRLSVPGPRIFASSNEESFEAAVSETINDLKVQLKKRKSEMKSFKRDTPGPG